jgi:hypothetical protein
MSVTAYPVAQLFTVIIGLFLIAGGIIGAYVCNLGMNGKIKPNGAVGVRLNLSRNYKLFQQDKYWYPINRFGSKAFLPWSIVLILLGIAEIMLPIDADTKLVMLLVFMLLTLAGMILTARQVYRYADGLVSS